MVGSFKAALCRQSSEQCLGQRGALQAGEQGEASLPAGLRAHPTHVTTCNTGISDPRKHELIKASLCETPQQRNQGCR